ncbi:hypothetical protein OC846_005939 [Tilletia horrida]|uniref:Dickkopf N-terminal cysteine-rich domain-containing protein n=1 Tax=Tilletia horrida TaxID=155126 RepID=A0AAN6GKC1_9BASI|nr:hypothetical protein OC846_005939 [Tilletia horrida]KAK0560921.1 hypothetical protein OC861_006065 [Tilletia horrida]
MVRSSLFTGVLIGLLGVIGTCTAAATNSTKKAYKWPDQPCTKDWQCKSGKCTDVRLIHDANGLSEGTYFDYTDPGGDKKCDWFGLNSTGCRSYRDCAYGLCLNKTCTTAKNGHRCIAGFQCDSGVCSNSGYCITPLDNHKRRAGRACDNGYNCLSGSCSSNFITRPSFTKPTYNITHRDDACQPSQFKGPCVSNSDCFSTLCDATTKTCYKLNRGDACTSNDQCSSAYCKAGQCTASSQSQPCGQTSDCIDHFECRDSDKTCQFVPTPDYECDSYRDCPSFQCDTNTHKCTAYSAGEYCPYNFGQFCISGSCVDQQCALSEPGQRCNKTSDCTSGNICTNGVCVAA